MAKGYKTGGRTVGTPNRVTGAIKEAFQSAFESIGGGDALAEWAKGNPTEFYKLAAKFIPQDVNNTFKEAPKIIFEMSNGGDKPSQ